MTGQPQFGMILYGETQALGEVIGFWQHGLSVDEFRKAEFPATHSVVSLFADPDVSGGEQMEEIIHALGALKGVRGGQSRAAGVAGSGKKGQGGAWRSCPW